MKRKTMKSSCWGQRWEQYVLVLNASVKLEMGRKLESSRQTFVDEQSLELALVIFFKTGCFSSCIWDQGLCVRKGDKDLGRETLREYGRRRGFETPQLRILW